MLQVNLCGNNAIQIIVDNGGYVQLSDSGYTSQESEFFDGYYDNVLLMGLHNDTFLPLLINENGELL